MGLKHYNHNSEIVLASKFNLVKQFLFEKLWKLHLEMNPTSYFSKNMFRHSPKQDCSKLTYPNGINQNFICRKKILL